MISLRKNREIDKAEWDNNIISTNSNPKPYNFSWFLDIIAPGWNALDLNIQGCSFPLTLNKKYGLRYLATPIFMQQSSIVPTVADKKNTGTDCFSFINKKFRLVDIAVNNYSGAQGFRITERINLYLPLINKYKELWESYSSDCRRNIRLAREYRHRVDEEISPSEILKLFRSNTGKYLRDVKENDYKKLEHLMRYCIDTRIGETYGVYISGQLIYAVFVINHANRLTLLFTATSKDSRNMRSGYLVADTIIHKYSGMDYVLDFAGSSIPGVRSYFKSFVSLEEKYYRLYNNRLPWPLHNLKD